MPPNTRGKGHSNLDGRGGSGNPPLVSEQVIGPTNTVEVPADESPEPKDSTVNPRPQLPSSDSTRSRLDHEIEGLCRTLEHRLITIIDARFARQDERLDNKMDRLEARFSELQTQIAKLCQTPPPFIPPVFGNVQASASMFDAPNPNLFVPSQPPPIIPNRIEGRGLSPLDWNEFKEKMILEYGPNELDDPLAALSKLRQLAGVADFYRDFIKIGHLVKRIDEEHLVSLFLAGLEPEIRLEVKLSKPQSVSSAFRLACAREEIIQLRRRPPPTRPPFVRAPTAPPPRTIVLGADANQGWAVKR